MREEAGKRKKEAEAQAKAVAEKLRWEQQRQREKEAREREARERLAKEKVEKEKEQREKERREREVRERIEREKRDLEKAAKAKADAEAAKKATAASSTGTTTPKPTASSEKKYERPTAKSYASTDATSDYFTHTDDKPRGRGPPTSSTSSYTASSYAPSISTARTSPPPPERRGPYKTSDPDKIIIKGVYQYNNAFPKPVSQLVSGEGSVTDGLVLRITTEGLFIDDDVRDVPQREWDVKAWGIKLVEYGEMKPFQLLRATTRDIDDRKYVVVLPSDQSWKLDMGLVKLKKGSQVRSLHTSSLKVAEMKRLLAELGYI